MDREIAVDSYYENRYTGSFIIIDKYSNNTLGAGMILESAISSTSKKTKQYTKAEIELNKYIRENFPEWECKAIWNFS